MKICMPSYFEDFKCSASSCSDTCCRYWQVELDRRTKQRYNEEIFNDSKLGKAIKPFIKKDRFVNCKNGNCPFLSENLLCNLHSEFEEEILPETCKLFPRFYNYFGAYVEQGLSFSCPTAAKIIMCGNSNLTILQDDKEISDYTDVNAELFYSVLNKRNEILEYLKDGADTLEIKISTIFAFANKVQRQINKKRYSEIAGINIADCRALRSDLFNEHLRKRAIRWHLKHRHLNNKWADMLKLAASNKFAVNDNDAIVWFTYFIYRYLIKSAYDKRFEEKVKAALLSLLVIGSLGLDFVSSAQKYSKETEHNEFNIRRLFKDTYKFSLTKPRDTVII